MTNKTRQRDPWGLEIVQPSGLRTRSPAPLYLWGNRAAAVLVALSVPFFSLCRPFCGRVRPAHRTQEQRRQQIERENAAFCEKYGMQLGTPQHARCAADLMAIRARENERTAAEVRELF